MPSLTNFPNGIRSFLVGPVLGGYGAAFGNVWFVNTAAPGSGTGKSPSQAFTTMARALAAVGDNDTIYFEGVIREQLVAPLGVTGVSIIGSVGGGVRDDNGAKWTYPATGAVAGQALIEIREQGWSFTNFLMTPEPTSGACIKAHRNEDATYPDSSHFIARGMRFVGGSLVTTYGIQDVGGNHHYLIEDCAFQTLTTGVFCSSTAIAIPLRNTIRGCDFMGNTNDIVSPMSYGVLQGNRHHNDNTVPINIGGGAGFNVVANNTFANVAADIDPAHGYTGNATDVWAANQATDNFIFGVPA